MPSIELFTGRAYSLRGDVFEHSQAVGDPALREQTFGVVLSEGSGPPAGSDEFAQHLVLGGENDDHVEVAAVGDPADAAGDPADAAETIPDEDDEEPGGDAYLTALELDDQLSALYKDCQELIQVYSSWEKVIIRHRYSKEIVTGIANEKATVMDLQMDLPANFGMENLLAVDMGAFTEKLNQANQSYQNLKVEVKKFLPRDIALALQLEPLQELVCETDHLAKRLRSI
jgi:hypothetical protein